MSVSEGQSPESLRQLRELCVREFNMSRDGIKLIEDGSCHPPSWEEEGGLSNEKSTCDDCSGRTWRHSGNG
jgi:hypothetical protein